MKKSTLALVLLICFTLSCGKQKAKQTQQNQALIELEEQIQEDQELINQLEEQEKELDAINEELESLLEIDE